MMDAIALSALQHYAFCPRQCALIHNEQLWAENFLTAQGRILHERVDSGVPETRKGIRYERGVAVSSQALGLIGKLDLLEVDTASGALKPVEYKRGRKKADDSDSAQLCAQALCLEEMCGVTIDEGVIWYGQTRRRETVSLDAHLRDTTRAIIADVRTMLESGQTPAPIYGKHCKACSLIDACQPQEILNDYSQAYVAALFDIE